MNESNEKPVVALTLGDPAGIGPELIARLLARPEATALANVVLVGRPLAVGRRPAHRGPAGRHAIRWHRFGEVRAARRHGVPAFLAVDTIAPGEVHRGTGRGGRAAARC